MCPSSLLPKEIHVIKLGYFLLFVTLSLMTWAYIVRAEASPFQSNGPIMVKGQLGTVQDDFPSCSFNPLCKCSNPGPTDFGIVSCHDIPFGSIPSALRTSRAFVLSMVNSDLDFLADRQLIGSALWRLEIRQSRLSSIGDDSLIGLEKSLWELDLGGNELTQIPSRALGRLSKLKLLDLSWNQITDVDAEDFQGVYGTLTCLNLAGNLLVYLPDGVFGNLTNLERLDLSHNSLRVIHGSPFFQTSQSLVNLHLAGNLLRKIPFESLLDLHLKFLDLSRNLITSTYDSVHYRGKLDVEELILDRNQILILEPFAFQNIEGLESLSIKYNPITLIDEDAFKDLYLKRLHLSHCFITHVHPKALHGLQSYLRHLDLSFNNITSLPIELFESFDHLQTLNVDENDLMMNPNQLDQLRYVLQQLSSIGDRLLSVPLPEFRTMRNLRKFNLSLTPEINSLSRELFDGFPPSVEEIRFPRSHILSINQEAFLHIPGVKVIDLSSSRITRIDNEAFAHVGHSLLKLKLNSALRMNTISAAVWEKLTKLQELDLSGNGLQVLPDSSFAKNLDLSYLNLRFNNLKDIKPLLFDALHRLHRLYLSFNSLTKIHSETFRRLKDLELIQLNENKLEQLEPRSFLDLTNLRILNLAGNRLLTLESETFQNLPKLQSLDLSFNRISHFNFTAFEQLGTLSHFRIDLSHNKIFELTPLIQKSGTSNDSHAYKIEVRQIMLPETIPLSSSSIEVLDLSHNNISHIAPYYFTPTGNTLLELDLSHNQLQNLSKSHLDGMRFLQVLHLEYNRLESLDYDTFRGIQAVQMIFMDENNLRELTPDLLEGSTNLRIFSVRGNRIRALTDSLFKDTKLEFLNLAQNLLVRFPETALNWIVQTLVKLDLSGNHISSLNSVQFEFLRKLRWLNLANNRIVVIGHGTFDGLQNLDYLDLSGNPIGRISSRLFENVKGHLLHLHLANMSLENLPDFDQFQQLLTFNVSHNALMYLPTNFGVNVSTLRTLDISNNGIPIPPNTIWHTIPRLTSIRIQSNPIRVLSNDSFLQLDRLHKLDISELPVEVIQMGTLSSLRCLRELTLGPLEEENLRSPASYIQQIESLQTLHLKLKTELMASELKTHLLPRKLENLTISGNRFTTIDNSALEGITNPFVKLQLHNTRIQQLPASVLKHLGLATTLSLEITGNNSGLTIIQNPNSEYRPEPFIVYLSELNLNSDLRLSCSCENGWMEFWLRHWMDKSCPITSLTPKEDVLECNAMLKKFRTVECSDKLGISMSEAFVSELECGWESSAVAAKPVSMLAFALWLFVVLISHF